MKSSIIRARVDGVLKAQARAVLASCGLEMSDALRLFLIQVVNRGGLPFPVRQVARRDPCSPKTLESFGPMRINKNMPRATRDNRPQKLPKPE
jgi:addiction module RelB/DinJ family antitoxin